MCEPLGIHMEVAMVSHAGTTKKSPWL